MPPHGLSPPGFSAHGDSPGKNTGVGCMPSSRGSSQTRDSPRVSCIAGGFLPSEPPGKPTLAETAWWTQETEAQPRRRRPLPGWANSHSLGVGDETGRAIMGAHRVFSCPWIYFGSGPEASCPGCRFLRGRWHLWRVGGREMAPFLWGTERSPRE